MFVKEEVRAKAGLVYNVVESVILAMSVGLMVWMCNVVISQGQILASHTTMLIADDKRLSEIESAGSKNLISHVKSDDQRVADITARIDKLETAVLALQSTPGELKANSVRLDSLREGQARIEKLLDDYMKRGQKP